MKILKEFHDINNMKHVYKIGDDFISDDESRVKSLVNRGLIEGVITPSAKPIKEKSTTKRK